MVYLESLLKKKVEAEIKVRSNSQNIPDTHATPAEILIDITHKVLMLYLDYLDDTSELDTGSIDTIMPLKSTRIAVNQRIYERGRSGYSIHDYKFG